MEELTILAAMNEPLTPPHGFGTAAAQMLLPVLPKEIRSNTESFLAGKLDGNLPVIFNSLSRQTMELACLKLFFTQAAADEVLDLLGQSALAQANKFRLLGDSNTGLVPITWAGTTRVIHVQPAMDMHNSLGISTALINATLADRAEDLVFLARIPRHNLQHSGIKQHEYTLIFTEYLQGLFGGAAAAYDLEDLEARILSLYSNNNADSAYIRAYVRAYIASGKLFQSAGQDVPLPALVADLLAAHKTLFDSDRDNMRWVVPGLICFHGLGIWALARKQGFEVSFNDPYLPQPLLSRTNRGTRLG